MLSDDLLECIDFILWLKQINLFYLQYFSIVMEKEGQFMKEGVMNAVNIHQEEAKSL